MLDPGPDDEAHIKRIARAGPARAISTIVVTHTHPDHSPGVAPLKALTGATVDRIRLARRASSPTIEARDGYVVRSGAFTLRAIHTPGHASNHLCWHLEDENLLFSGDHVMAGSTVVISPPDGDMKPYLDSLGRVRALGVANIAAAHGPLLPRRRRRSSGDTSTTDSRVSRWCSTRSVGAGEPQSTQLVEDVYTDVAPILYPIAQLLAVGPPAQDCAPRAGRSTHRAERHGRGVVRASPRSIRVPGRISCGQMRHPE